MKKILVPTDFSKTADLALDYAIKIAKCFNAEVSILNSYDVPHSGSSLMVNIDGLLQQDSIDALANYLEKRKEESPEITFHTYAVAGTPDDAVMRFLNSNDMDMVIMGTTGASGIKGVLLGSNTASLIKNIKTPLLIIPAKSDQKDPTKIGIATDLKFKLNDNIYNPVKEIAKVFGSKVSFFNVNDLHNDEQLDAIEKDFGTDIDFVYGHDTAEGINEYLEDTALDLLVLVSEKHGLMHKIFKPSMTKTMAKSLHMPMLILYQK